MARSIGIWLERIVRTAAIRAVCVSGRTMFARHRSRNSHPVSSIKRLEIDMAHSSTPGSASMSTDGTMVAVPSPGGNEKFDGMAAQASMTHGSFPEGGSQKVSPVAKTASKLDWPSHGGNQQIKS